MVATAELGSDGRCGHLAQVVGEIDRDMTREGDGRGAPGTYQLLVAHVVELLDHPLDHIDMDDLARGVEVGLCRLIDIRRREFEPCRLALGSEPRAAFAETFEVADVVARDLRHVAQMLQ